MAFLFPLLCGKFRIGENRKRNNNGVSKKLDRTKLLLKAATSARFRFFGDVTTRSNSTSTTSHHSDEDDDDEVDVAVATTDTVTADSSIPEVLASRPVHLLTDVDNNKSAVTSSIIDADKTTIFGLAMKTRNKQQQQPDWCLEDGMTASINVGRDHSDKDLFYKLLRDDHVEHRQEHRELAHQMHPPVIMTTIPETLVSRLVEEAFLEEECDTLPIPETHERSDKSRV